MSAHDIREKMRPNKTESPPDSSHTESGAMSGKTISGTPLSSGTAPGPLEPQQEDQTPAPRQTEGGTKPHREYQRLIEHTENLAEDLRRRAEELQEDDLHSEAQIFYAHASILEDEELYERARSVIYNAELAAEEAAEQVLTELAELFRQSDDPVMSERAADFRDLANQLRRRLRGPHDRSEPAGPEQGQATVLAVRELFPSTVLHARRQQVSAFVAEEGTQFSHGAILAGSFGLPAVLVPSLDELQDERGREVLVDGTRGELVIDPSPEDIRQRSPARRQPTGKASRQRSQKLHARLWLNVATPDQLQSVDWTGLEGVGLYRTEALFMQQPHDFPGETEQIETYRALFDRAEGKTVTVRTLDIGGDKPVEYMFLGPQENPQLGLRAHRLFRFHPEILETQIRAILRAARGCHGLRIMYPMVESLDEWDFVNDLTDRAISSLEADGLDFRRDFDRGPLVETPSAVWDFPALIDRGDFASVGTNDLVQYLFAVDRNTANVASMYRPEHPVFLQVLKRLVNRSREAEKPLSVCGEIAADAHLLPVLVGLGLENLSVATGAVETVKEQLRELDLEACRGLARDCLNCNRTAEVVERLREWHSESESPSRDIQPDAIDPVCKMAVDPGKTPFTLERDGVNYYFCSRRCLNLFEKRL